MFSGSERSGLDAVVAVKNAVEEGVGAFPGCAGAGDGGGMRREEWGGLWCHCYSGGIEGRLLAAGC